VLVAHDEIVGVVRGGDLHGSGPEVHLHRLPTIVFHERGTPVFQPILWCDRLGVGGLNGLGEVPKVLKGHLPRAIYHPVYWVVRGGDLHGSGPEVHLHRLPTPARVSNIHVRAHVCKAFV